MSREREKSHKYFYFEAFIKPLLDIYTSTHSQLYFQLEEYSINKKTDDDTEHTGKVTQGL